LSHPLHHLLHLFSLLSLDYFLQTNQLFHELILFINLVKALFRVHARDHGYSINLHDDGDLDDDKIMMMCYDNEK
jgi:hypothetical protein